MKKIMRGSQKIWSAGNIVTYRVDSGISYTEEIDEGADCLSPKSFAPAKTGWEFVGWRQDTTASGSVLGSLAMGDAPITLYAVFRKTVTVTYYNLSTAASRTSGYRYYNNGNIVNPSFTLTQAASSGWTARGWSTSNAGNAAIAYGNGATFTRDSDVTLYGLYQQTITVTYYNGSTSASKTTGTRYWAPAGAINPSFTLTQAALSGWAARGWSTGTAGNSGITYNNGVAFTRDSNVTLYGMYYQTVVLTTVANGVSSNSNGIRYYNPGSGKIVNPTFTVANPSKSGATFQGWSTSASSTAVANSSISGLELGASATRYAVFKYNDLADYTVRTYTIKNMASYYNASQAITLLTIGEEYTGWTISAAVGDFGIAQATSGHSRVEVSVCDTVARVKYLNNSSDDKNGTGREETVYVYTNKALPGANGARFTLSGTGAITASAKNTTNHSVTDIPIYIYSVTAAGKTVVG
ncbi:MAG: InlB B-repeat-containing protein [Roseburia sp.]|nr:InlB B-repeat-containing protein [Roseburia sp.]